jgi:TolA-binding protein
MLAEAVQFLETQAEQLKGRQPPVEARARMLYEAAWGHRTLAEAEVASARNKIEKERLDKAKQEAARKGTSAAPVVAEVRRGEVPLQPAEQKARGHYRELIAAFPESPLAGEARLELSELFAERGEIDAAVALLREGLDKEPPPELTERLRLRLGACLAEKGDPKSALAQFAAVLANPKSPLLAQAHYRSGECLMSQGQFAEAVKHLALFRDRGEFQQVSGVSDKALLRLGHALAQLKQWEPSRQAHEALAGRFPNSAWAHEARYGIGWAWQNLKQYDAAVSAYAQVVAGTTTELAARAQVQIGLCRIEQKRYAEAATALLVVPFTYDYPEWSAVALCEAARCFAEQKQTDQAARLLERVVRDHGSSEWAAVAKQRLAALKRD